jgi:hypothetical protein
VKKETSTNPDVTTILTYAEASGISAAFVGLKDKDIPFKAALVISRNVQKLDQATEPFRKAAEGAAKRFQEFKTANDAKDVDAVVKEAALTAFGKKLEDEINAESNQPSGLDRSELEALPDGALDGTTVKVSEVHLLLTQGLIK